MKKGFLSTLWLALVVLLFVGIVSTFTGCATKVTADTYIGELKPAEVGLPDDASSVQSGKYARLVGSNIPEMPLIGAWAEEHGYKYFEIEDVDRKENVTGSVSSWWNFSGHSTVLTRTDSKITIYCFSDERIKNALVAEGLRVYESSDYSKAGKDYINDMNKQPMITAMTYLGVGLLTVGVCVITIAAM